MTPVTDRSFGLLIAYAIPGFSVIWLWGQRFPAVSAWLAADHSTAPSMGGFLYVTVASIAVGLLLSTLRWAILDWVHHLTGVVPAKLTYSTDPASLEAYRLVVDLHYRYYQFYGSSLLVLVALLMSPPGGSLGDAVTTLGARLALVVGVGLYFAASRDTLAKCYSRGSSGDDPTDPGYERTDAMTNGGHYGHVIPDGAINRKTNEHNRAAATERRREGEQTDASQELVRGTDIEGRESEANKSSLPYS